MSSVGFIILRHVNSEVTNKYWILSYNSIRKLYPENKILIIDDNSDSRFITVETLHNTDIINSEYPGRGELLPYYYYLSNKLFDIAVIIHDSVFINQCVDTNVETYRPLWSFEHKWDQIEDEKRMLDVYNDCDLKDIHDNKDLWKGIFGAMSIISHNYLTHVNNKYEICKLIDCVRKRFNRSSFERVLACLLQISSQKVEPLFGDIHKYCPWGISFSKVNDYKHLPITKIWTGR